MQKVLETIDDLNYDIVNVVGNHTPSIAQEYPDSSGHEHGDAWVIHSLGVGNTYTFTGGPLSGEIVSDGDVMVWLSGTIQWMLMTSAINPTLFYRLDGIQPLTADFQAGGFKLSDIADGTLDTDAATVNQLNDKLDITGGELTGNLGLRDLGGNVPNIVFLRDTGEVLSDIGSNATTGNIVFDVWNDAGDSILSQFAMRRDGNLTINGDSNIAWHAGNFDPDSKSDITHNHDSLYDALGSADTVQVNLDTHTSASNPHSITTTLIGAEAALGNPTADNYVLSSLTDGTRSWIPMTGGGGSSTFTGLIDVPDSYSGFGGYYVKINATETGVTFEQGSGITVEFRDIDGEPRQNVALATELQTHDDAIANNASDIADNLTAINTNATDIATNVQNIATNATNIQTNTSKIAELEAKFNSAFQLIESGGSVVEIVAQAYFSGIDEVKAFRQ